MSGILPLRRELAMLPGFNPAVGLLRYGPLYMSLSAQGVSGLANLGLMTAWPDLSGNGRTPTAAGLARPEWRASGGPNGKPFVHFDGNFQGFTLAGAVIPQPRTYILVTKRDYFPGFYGRVIWVGGNAGEVTFNQIANSAMTWAGALLAGSYVDGDWAIITVVHNGASSLLRINGVQTSGNVGAGNINASMYIGGAMPDTLYYLLGGIAECHVITRAVPVTELQAIELELSKFYGIAVTP